MMDDWKELTLGDVASIQTGPFGSQLHASDYVTEGVPSIMPKNIGARLDISTDDIARIRESDAVRLTKYRIEKNDIVYSRRGDVEKCAFITSHQDGWLCGTGCIRVRFVSKEVYAMQSPTVANATKQLGETPESYHLPGIKQQPRGDRKAGVVFSTIQKFQPEDGNVYEQLSDRKNIVVIADEAHRTQYGFQTKTVDVKDDDGNVL